MVKVIWNSPQIKCVIQGDGKRSLLLIGNKTARWEKIERERIIGEADPITKEMDRKFVMTSKSKWSEFSQYVIQRRWGK